MKGKETKWLRQKGMVLLTGVVLGLAALLLTQTGNPGNMGFCIACFLRDTAGAMGLHSASNVQYVRPEIVGLVLGSLIAAVLAKEFRARGGSSPATRFVLGAVMMIGALVFLGCPLRMVLRLGGGDLTAVAGLLGFVAGILLGVLCLKKGFNLGRSYEQRAGEGLVLPGFLTALLLLLVSGSALLCASTQGPGSKHAPWWIALAAGLIVGALCQRSRLCMAGGLRDVILMKDFTLLGGFLALWVTVTAGNLLLGSYQLSALLQPVAHSQYLWSGLGMLLVGWAAILLGGCPLRQLILAGQGSSDAALAVLGMMAGAAISHNFGLAGAADRLAEDGSYLVGGVGSSGKIGVLVCLAVLLGIVLTHLPGKEKKYA